MDNNNQNNKIIEMNNDKDIEIAKIKSMFSMFGGDELDNLGLKHEALNSCNSIKECIAMQRMGITLKFYDKRGIYQDRTTNPTKLL